MWFSRLWRALGSPTDPRRQSPVPRTRRARLAVERLEDRTVPASFTPTNVSELIAAMDAANLTLEGDTINLVAGKTYTLTNQHHNDWNGATGLPRISDDLTIVGNGATIERSVAKKTPAFRLFEVWPTGSLTLENLTLQRGLASSAEAAEGGAIYSLGALTLRGVTVQYNVAQGIAAAAARGGAIWSSGSLTIEHSIIRHNQALGGKGFANCDNNAPGGSAAGGGLYIAGGPAALFDLTFYANTAVGGDGGKGRCSAGPRTGGPFVSTDGGSGFGGALFAAGGSVSLLNSSVTNNSATGGRAGSADAVHGVGQGGGLYLAAAASVCLDLFTQANTKSNSPDDIFGSYVRC